jgi:integrase
VFKGQHGNAVNDGWFRKHVFGPAVKSTGLSGVTFHCLRHTAASQLIRLGAPVTTVANILGHASTQMTLDVYGHHYENGQSQYMERYEADFQAGTEQERNGNVIEFPNDGAATA